MQQLSDNPLRQFFRRPAVYIRLPSGGKGYSPDVLDMPENEELPVYAMTAIDEITVRTPDALFNGSAIVDLIKSCIPNIKNPWGVLSADLDAILIGIKIASQGNEMEMESQCTKCEEISNYGMNLSLVLNQLKQSNYDETLILHDLEFKFKSLTYKEMNEANLAQLELQQTIRQLQSLVDEEEIRNKGKDTLKKVTDITMQILVKTIEYVKTPTVTVTDPEYILDFLRNCDAGTFTEIKEYQTKLKNTAEIKPLNVKCPSCGNEYEQPFTVNATDFFA